MTMEERLIALMFSNPKETKNIHYLNEDERAECSNGHNSSIEIIINDGEVLVTGGTLFERCLLAQSDINVVNTLKETSVEEIIKVVKEGEEVSLYIFEDTIMVLSDLRYESNVERTYFLPIGTDLATLEALTGIEINDLR